MRYDQTASAPTGAGRGNPCTQNRPSLLRDGSARPRIYGGALRGQLRLGRFSVAGFHPRSCAAATHLQCLSAAPLGVQP